MADSIVPPSEPVAPSTPPAVASTEEAKPFWESVAFWAAILVVAGFFFKGLDLDPTVRDSLAGAMAVLGSAGTVWGRWRASKKLTWRRRRH